MPRGRSLMAELSIVARPCAAEPFMPLTMAITTVVACTAVTTAADITLPAGFGTGTTVRFAGFMEPPRGASTRPCTAVHTPAVRARPMRQAMAALVRAAAWDNRTA